MAVKKQPDNVKIRTEEIDALFRNNLHRIVPVDLDNEMKKAFIDYAMSVISDRALPDVRDGLKPVHRRILYAMFSRGFTPDKSFRKCATTVGDVLGKFHPHGDAAVYDALVRLAQDFSMRHTLVDGHGNFGSRDGDPPAAYRYTEARLTKISMEMMSDINKDAVDFKPNFDEHEMEPVVLPSRFPNLLVNGSTGIAVGMATNIPPHNLGETIDAVIHLMKNPGADLSEILEFLPGPDFPTGGIILGVSGIRAAYKTGRGRIVVRANAQIEENGNKQRIIINDLPYMVNKARVIEKIAELVKEKKIDGISFIRDESDREDPVRIIVEIKRDANANVVLNQLYKLTQLQDSFSVNLLALVPNKDGRYEPQTLSLIDCLNYYIDHQKDVVRRRTTFDLDKALARQHILEGLRIAFVHIDEIIELIKSSKNGDEAKNKLSETFGFTEKQAQHIVDIRLVRLTNLEQLKIENEHAETVEKIAYYNSILQNEDKLISVLAEELIDIKNRFADERRSEINMSLEEAIEDESLIQEEEIAITMTHFGYIKRQSIDNYRAQKRGGVGISGMSTREEDFVETILTGSTHSIYLFLTDKGRIFKLKGYQLPDAGRQAKGTAVVNLLQLQNGEKVKAVIPISDFSDEYSLLVATAEGMVKKTILSEYANISKAGIIAISLKESDSLVGVSLIKEDQEVILCTAKGNANRFDASQIRNTGRNTMGVRGIKLRADDRVVGMIVHKESDATSANERERKSLLVVSRNGLGKRTAFTEYTKHNRGGFGSKTYKVTEKSKDVAGVASVCDNDDLILITEQGTIIRISCADISELSRNTQGVKLMRTKQGEIVDMAVVAKAEDEAEI